MKATFVEQPIYWEGSGKGIENSTKEQTMTTTNIVKKTLAFLPWFSRKVQERIVSPHSTFDVHVQLDVRD